MATTLNQRDLYTGVDYQVMQRIVDVRERIRAHALTNLSEAEIDAQIIRENRIPGVSSQRLREYCTYMRAGGLNTHAKVDRDFNEARRQCDAYFQDQQTERTLQTANSNVRAARSRNRSVNGRMFGWGLARFAVPFATLAAIGGGIFGVGALLTSSAFATLLGGPVGVGIFGVAAIGVLGYGAFKLVKAGLRFLKNTSRTKWEQAVQDKTAARQELQQALEAQNEANRNAELRASVERQNAAYRVPNERQQRNLMMHAIESNVAHTQNALDTVHAQTLRNLQGLDINALNMADLNNAQTQLNRLFEFCNNNEVQFAENANTLHMYDADCYEGQEDQVAQALQSVEGIQTNLQGFRAQLQTLQEAMQQRAQDLGASLQVQYVNEAQSAYNALPMATLTTYRHILGLERDTLLRMEDVYFNNLYQNFQNAYTELSAFIPSLQTAQSNLESIESQLSAGERDLLQNIKNVINDLSAYESKVALFEEIKAERAAAAERRPEEPEVEIIYDENEIPEGDVFDVEVDLPEEEFNRIIDEFKESIRTLNMNESNITEIFGYIDIYCTYENFLNKAHNNGQMLTEQFVKDKLHQLYEKLKSMENFDVNGLGLPSVNAIEVTEQTEEIANNTTQGLPEKASEKPEVKGVTKEEIDQATEMTHAEYNAFLQKYKTELLQNYPDKNSEKHAVMVKIAHKISKQPDQIKKITGKTLTEANCREYFESIKTQILQQEKEQSASAKKNIEKKLEEKKEAKLSPSQRKKEESVKTISEEPGMSE